MTDLSAQSNNQANNIDIKSAGVELGRFRLKAGISENDLQVAHRKMVRLHLSEQSGWHSQKLIKLTDNTFIDLVFADTIEHAQAICASWQGQPVCDAFLAMIDPISMEFGSVL